MTNIENDDQEDKPLDPVMENVRRKMVRLQLVSGGIMLLMFMAVLAAIVYKVTSSDGKPQVQSADGLSVPSDAPIQASVTLPDGFAVSAVSHSDARILFYGVLADGSRKAFLYDIAANRIVAEIDVNGN
jgi:hypothetical protein